MKKVLRSSTQNEVGLIIIVFGEGRGKYLHSIKPCEIYLNTLLPRVPEYILTFKCIMWNDSVFVYIEKLKEKKSDHHSTSLVTLCHHTKLQRNFFFL